MYRTEDKYYLSPAEMDILENKIRTFLRTDENADESGVYHVSSLYFDDYKDGCFRETIDGTPVRKKYRIRIYENSFENAKLEIKEKHYRASRKISSPIEKEEVKALINGELFELNDSDEARRVFYADYEKRILRPAVIVSYTRSAYIYEPGNVRITFDRNIRASGDFKRFGKKKMIFSNLEGVGVVEVKYDTFIPTFISKLLETGSMNLVSNSKYVLCRIAINKKGEFSL